MNEHKETLSNLISEGEQVLSLNNILPGVEPKFVPKQAFETWMGKINTFNERHLKKHPMNHSIFTCYFHRKNTPTCCYEMMGLLQSVECDNEFWGITKGANAIASRSSVKMNQTKRIFISHRTTDAEVADIIRDFIVALGAGVNTVFCSSLPGNDVKEKISEEVKEALQNSCLNIVILSKAFYESAYCLNEAGILWYNTTTVLPIALPDIQPSDMIGFLNDEYKLRRLDNDDDIAYIADLLVDVGAIPNAKNAIVRAQAEKMKARYAGISVQSPPVKESAALSLFGIQENGKLSTAACFQKVVLQSEKNVNSLANEIRELYSAIQKIHINDIAPVVRGGLFPNRPVDIPEEMKIAIKTVADEWKISLKPDFFFLGSLSKPFDAAPSFLSAPKLDGTKEEIEKYNTINKLYRKIDELLRWLPVETGFENLMCVKLVLGNSGITPDEDIDVSLRIPKEAYLTTDDLPPLDLETKRFIVKDCDLSNMLGIASTAEYNDYDSTIAAIPHAPHYSRTPGLWDQTDYDEEYSNELHEALGCEVYEDGDYYVVKTKFDYLKHNTKAAFPAITMLKKKVDVIHYQITSRSSAQIISGKIVVE